MSNNRSGAATNTTEETPLLGGGSGKTTTEQPQQQQPVAATKVNDGYIISLIRRTSTVNTTTTTTNNNNNNRFGNGNNVDGGDEDGLLANDDDDDDDDDDEDHGGTTYGQTIIHLVKGYVGCGILSLPWAVSQLGLPLGLLGIVTMSLWSSYNCWTVVKLKRYIERTTINTNDSDSDDSDDSDAGASDDAASDTSKLSKVGSKSGASSVASSNITYPDVGEWAHGIEFQKYISICICAQQLAICTVFISFVSENLLATVEFYLQEGGGDYYHNINHLTIGAMAMPLFLALSCGLPSLKSMAPFMACGFILMLSGFASLGLIGYLKWEDRPTLSAGVDLPTLKIDKNAPMALCGILYSFEGICIILPVESSMKYSNTHFKTAFIISMIIVTLLLCTMAGMGVYVFGEVSNGSITAFLLEEYKDDTEIQFWLMVSNLLVTISIIFSYPLMLFPAIELIAPLYYNWKIRVKRKYYNWWNYVRNKQNDGDADDSSSSDDSLGFSAGGNPKDENDENNNDNNNNDGEEEQNLEGFEPMVGIPEHDVASMASLPESTYHEYNNSSNNNNNNSGNNNDENDNDNGDGKASSAAAALVAAVASDTETTKTGEATDGGGLSESASLSHLSSVDNTSISYQRSIVEGDDDNNNNNNNERNNRSTRNDDTAANRERQQRELSSAFEWNLPGDSPWLRAGIVIGTYLVAMVVPNVQSLVSLVGAVTGSSTALLIPPILELAYINHMETLRERGIRKQPHLGEWGGGPSTALKRTLFGSPAHHHRHPNVRSSTNKRERSNGCRTSKRRNKYLFKKILSWFLLILGSIFALIGSYFSIRDIIQSYSITAADATTASM